jgi:hypothetical protein
VRAVVRGDAEPLLAMVVVAELLDQVRRRGWMYIGSHGGCGHHQSSECEAVVIGSGMRVIRLD